VLNQRGGSLRGRIQRLLLLGSALLLAAAATAQTSKQIPVFARANSFGIFTAYSNTSSHILLGEAQDRKLLLFGGSYSRRLILNRSVNLQYNVELMPLLLEGDPTDHITVTWIQPAPFPPLDATLIPYTACHASSGTGTALDNGIPFTFSYANQCGRRWSKGEAMSPFGFRSNFRPRSKTQLFLVGHGGYMYTTQVVPVDGAGAFNFTFDAGIGVEMYRSRTKSVSFEYRYHHFSNNNTASANPGVDNGLFQATYSFGR
jgi:opacity protein-like surface antigen